MEESFKQEEVEKNNIGACRVVVVRMMRSEKKKKSINGRKF